MKLRFEVQSSVEGGNNQVTTLKIDPKKLPQQTLILLADRLIGIDVCNLWNSNDGTVKSRSDDRKPLRIVAKSGTLESLVTAMEQNQLMVTKRLNRHRKLALDGALRGVDTFPKA